MTADDVTHCKIANEIDLNKVLETIGWKDKATMGSLVNELRSG